ncbi:beta family protein [Nonomuraea sp. NPDC004580]|uniref:beta family protein n=1 Tax=Nonomuraea sp. NPDC004580 TaxID=3154552 RepID=UPI0033ADBCAB
MTVYMPILKGRASEIQALGKIQKENLASVRALIEVMPPDQSPEDGRQAVIEAATIFEKRVKDHLPRQRVFAVDCTRLLSRRWPHVCGAISGVSNIMHRHGYSVIPVIRPTDRDCELVDAGRAAKQHQKGVCLRVQWGEHRTAADDGQLARRVRQLMGLGLSDFDLLVDVWSVDSDSRLRKGIERARQALTWAGKWPFRSLTLAAGAFPKDLGDVPFDTPTAIPRHDACLWSSAAAAYEGPLDVFYGDYGVSSPRAGQGFNPHPNLRYTVRDQWVVYRCKKLEGPGALRGFQDLCRAVIADQWPPFAASYSWGDQQIERFALGQPELPWKMESWQICGMSHHFATVLDRLANLGQA